MANQDIRRFAAGAGVKLWQIAEALGIADCSLDAVVGTDEGADGCHHR